MTDRRKISGMNPSQVTTGDELVEIVQWNSIKEQWENFRIELRELEGAPGKPGKSIYQVAVDNGFKGTPQDFIQSQKGKTGEGKPGPRGLDAHAVAVEEGFEGNRAEWLASLKGDNAFEVVRGRGLVNTLEEWLALIAQYGGLDGEGNPLYQPSHRVQRVITLTNNDVNAKIVMVAWGTQDDLDTVEVGHSGGNHIELANIPEKLTIESISMAYENGFNATSQFSLSYPEPFGETETMAMNIPVFYQFSHANPPTLQPMTQQSYQNDDGQVTCLKVGLIPGRGYHWKFYLY